MQLYGIVLLLGNRWSGAIDPPKESEAWWLARTGRERATLTTPPALRPSDDA